MPTRWHHSRQELSDPPVSSAELRRLVAAGSLGANDLVRREDAARWVAVANVEGLVNAESGTWYYTQRGLPFGPVPFRYLRQMAAAGLLMPDDWVLKAGTGRWDPARTLAGLFPDAAAPLPPPPIPCPDPPSRNQDAPGFGCLGGPSPGPSAAPPGLPAPLAGLASRLPSLVVSAALLGLAAAGAVWGLGGPRPSGPVADGGASPRRPGARPVRDAEGAVADVAILDRSPAGEAEEVRRRVRHRLSSPAQGLEEPADPGAFSFEEERRLGQAVHNAILRERPVVEAGPLRRRVEAATAPWLALRRREDLDYSVTILDSREVVSLSHLGGYIYVSRGLVDASDDEDLRRAIGHEIAHLELKHGRARLVRTVDEAHSRGGDGAGLAARILERDAGRYDDDEEDAADAWVVRGLARLRGTRGGRHAPPPPDPVENVRPGVDREDRSLVEAGRPLARR